MIGTPLHVCHPNFKTRHVQGLVHDTHICQIFSHFLISLPVTILWRQSCPPSPFYFSHAVVSTLRGMLEFTLNSLSPYSGENETSLYIVNTCSNIQVMRIKRVITKSKDKMS